MTLCCNVASRPIPPPLLLSLRTQFAVLEIVLVVVVVVLVFFHSVLRKILFSLVNVAKTGDSRTATTILRSSYASSSSSSSSSQAATVDPRREGRSVECA